jgi:histidinol-phosphatase (PHP family)
VLTDYHVHLRQDEPDTPAERHFTDDNVDRYLEAARSRGIEELGVSEHVHRFRQSLDVWTHRFWRESAVDDLDEYVDFLAAGPLRAGIEMDYIAGAEERIAALLDGRPFDYVIGSVHFVGEGAVDHDRFDVWELEGRDPERVWGRYFETLAMAASSGLYDTLAHPDLVKVWGAGKPSPEGDLRRFYEPAVAAIAEAGVAVEVSTSGLRKPVGELYPARPFAELCVQAGVPFTLSSDAHTPDDVGRDYDRALEFMRDLGIAEICVFEGRMRRMEPLG